MQWQGMEQEFLSWGWAIKTLIRIWFFFISLFFVVPMGKIIIEDNAGISEKMVCIGVLLMVSSLVVYVVFEITGDIGVSKK